MPALTRLLSESMLFTAAKGRNVEPFIVTDGSFRSPAPRPTSASDAGRALTPDEVRSNKIWRFRWSRSKPATFTEVTVLSRGMGMDYRMPVPVFDRLEFGDVAVLRQDGTKVALPLDDAHCIGAWFCGTGHVRGSTLWPLEARTDSSMLVAFAYQLDGTSVVPMTMDECIELGDEFMPPGLLPPRRLEFMAGTTPEAWVCVGPVRYLVVVELVLCREHDDFVPGNMVGFARIHPHALVWANEELTRVETTILLERPTKAMTCGDETMKDRHKALLVSDTNESHAPLLPDAMPIPFTDVLYDYYDSEPYEHLRTRSVQPGDHPQQRNGEVTLTDARFKRARVLERVVQRHSMITTNDRDVVKVPRQGQFDNVHIAPRMRLEFSDLGRPVVLDEIVMINQCWHDCTHMHVRWAEFLTDQIMCGFSGDRPCAKPGAPLVPENQTVFASFPSQHALRYRAIAEGVGAGRCTVVCHHGLAYAIDEWPTATAKAKIFVLHDTIADLARIHGEPYSLTMPKCWASFYWRVRYHGGSAAHPLSRSVFDLEKCIACE